MRQKLQLGVQQYNIENQMLPDGIKDYIADHPEIKEYAAVYDGKVLFVEEMEGVKKEASSSVESALPENQAADNHPSASEISIEKLISLVNEKDKKYIPKPSRNDTQMSERQGYRSDRQVLADALIKMDGISEEEKRELEKYKAQAADLDKTLIVSFSRISSLFRISSTAAFPPLRRDPPGVFQTAA